MGEKQDHVLEIVTHFVSITTPIRHLPDNVEHLPRTPYYSGLKLRGLSSSEHSKTTISACFSRNNLFEKWLRIRVFFILELML
jgi:hypothetical protein